MVSGTGNVQATQKYITSFDARRLAKLHEHRMCLPPVHYQSTKSEVLTIESKSGVNSSIAFQLRVITFDPKSIEDHWNGADQRDLKKKSQKEEPMAMEQVMSDQDSEDELDDEIADFEDRRMLDDFVDVNKNEKQVMHLWNSFLRKQRNEDYRYLYFAEKPYIDIRKSKMHIQNDDKRLLEGLNCEWNLRIYFQSKMKDDLDTLSIMAGEFQQALRAINCFLNMMKMTARDALNFALNEEMFVDPKVFFMSEKFRGSWLVSKNPYALPARNSSDNKIYNLSSADATFFDNASETIEAPIEAAFCAYEHVTFDGDKYISLASLPEMQDRTVITSSL
ncbi:hypothetical protein ACFE04_017773 [Oxalis oulophora]